MHRQRFALVTAFVVGASVSSAAAFHTVFEYGIDRVEVDGNVHGPSDGTPDLIDEFDDGALAPAWTRFFGTVVETGGHMLFTNPGTHFSISGLPFETDQSDAMSAGGPFVRDAAGNLMLRVFWRPDIVAPNDYLHATVWAGSDFLGLALTNFDESIANRYDPPWPTGLAVTAHREMLSGFTLVTMQREHLLLGTGSATGALVFELAYDDSARQWAAGVSQDGGTTFDRSFPPLPVPSFDGSGQVTGTLIVGGDPYELPTPPPPTGCTGAGLGSTRVVLSGFGRGAGNQTVRVRTRFGHMTVFDPVAEGAEVLVSDDAGALAHVSMPAGPGCDPRDGWVLRGENYLYRNESGALPPACLPGSSGLVTAKIRFNTSWDAFLKVKVRKTTTAAVQGWLAVNFTRGVPVALPECQSWGESNLYCESNASRAKCS